MTYFTAPIVPLIDDITIRAGISLVVKREDLNHPRVSGNKWWKLRYNVDQAHQEEHSCLLTLGGAYSNHIYAVAAVAADEKFDSIGIIRGEEIRPLNPTLSFAKRQGMQLHFVSRHEYRSRSRASFLVSLKKQFGRFYFLPEGGTNRLAVQGCEEWARQLGRDYEFDRLCVPIGTGGTMAGMINGLAGKKIIGFSSLKGGDFLYNEVKKWLTSDTQNWHIETNYHVGGYGKTTDSLMAFIHTFEQEHAILLDPVYMGKMMYGIYDGIKQGKYPRGTKMLVLHTGGLQGRGKHDVLM